MRNISVNSSVKGHFRGEFVSVVFAASSVLLLSFCIITHESNPVLADFYSIQIHDGKFEIQDDSLSGQDSSINLIAKANAPVTLNFVSCDFVYTVFQAEHDLAKVVLPGKSALLDVNLPPGVWEFRIAQGCGARSTVHPRRLLLESVGQP